MTSYIATAPLQQSSSSLPALAELQLLPRPVPPAAGKGVRSVAEADTGVSGTPGSFGCWVHPLLLELLFAGETKGFTPLQAAAVRCRNSYQELEEEDEGGWVWSQKPSPLFLCFQLFIKAQCKGPDTRPARPGCCDLCDTATVEPVMRDLLLHSQLRSRCLRRAPSREGRRGVALF